MTTSMAPEAPGSGPPDPDEPTDAELTAYVGRRAPHYLERWSRGDRWGFNWAAFFLGNIWLAYRGLYGVVVVATGVQMLATTALAVLVRGHLHDPDASAIATFRAGIALGVSIVVGQYANYWYYRKAERAVSDARARFPLENARLLQLRKRGDASWLRIAAVIPVVLLAWLAWGIALRAFGLALPLA